MVQVVCSIRYNRTQGMRYLRKNQIQKRTFQSLKKVLFSQYKSTFQVWLNFRGDYRTSVILSGTRYKHDHTNCISLFLIECYEHPLQYRVRRNWMSFINSHTCFKRESTLILSKNISLYILEWLTITTFSQARWELKGWTKIKWL